MSLGADQETPGIDDLGDPSQILAVALAVGFDSALDVQTYFNAEYTPYGNVCGVDVA